ncbi:MAG: Rieske 2Fe-2S domain-containing protein [Kofleriaceae bacterium]
MLRVRLARVADLPLDDLRAFPVDGLTWPVLAGVIGGAVVATAGVCPHEDVGLAGGTVEDGCLTCPGHGYQFDLATGACRHDRSLLLRRYRAIVLDGEVWIELV